MSDLLMYDSQNSYVVLTTINAPTKAVCAFIKQHADFIIVIGDRKTPEPWAGKGCRYYSYNDQFDLNLRVVRHIPDNHYSRKNIGYVLAARSGAERICDTDDDNIPYESWSFPSFNGLFDVIETTSSFYNIYRKFTSKKIWPRGFPLHSITGKEENDQSVLTKQEAVSIGVWQGLADGDPDVDAIYRLVSDEPVVFDRGANPVVLPRGTICPFNSQNTCFAKDFFPLLYLPTTVSFRYTDILRGVVAQPILWSQNAQLGFVTANVVQERNPHNYMKDFEEEISMYLSVEKATTIAHSVAKSEVSVAENLFQVYTELARAGIVARSELEGLEAFLLDINP